ncbi:hypothetical protein SEMRO_4749_G354570.1 [Seminavis robusta]|uniref:Uncharacterized protein n=1 Tax=Seminavis robusta TaxID=568900 RepID=A0A9N8HZZ5_9STRA|nr:hypothetical protein SEMRO_4749_G354570.1 [Seminavis robusta]|eukprot:Sro4749_g354570.1 n/a (124) ;mRNA; f:204-575
MVFFSDPAASSVVQDATSIFALDGGDEICTAPRRKSSLRKLMDFSAASNSSELGSTKRSSRKSKIRRSQSTVSKNSNSADMQQHLEEMEAFCQALQDVGSKKRKKILRQSMMRAHSMRKLGSA